MHFIIEALIVGLISATIGFIVSTSLMYERDPNFSLKKYTFWPWVLVGYFITGVIAHLLFEFSGANKWYCKNGYACSS